ncbi:MAG: hypothetical protein RI956_117 [Pseudomonadota bacterium]
MNNLIKTVILSTLLITLTACNSGVDSSAIPQKTPAEQITALELAGKIPSNLDRTDTLAGIDANGNGIRDDVDAYILAQFTPSQQPVARQMAKSVQKEILVDKSDNIAVRLAQRESSRAINCIYDKYPSRTDAVLSRRLFDEITAITTNTKPRLLAYLAMSDALDGTVLSISTGDTCE